MEVKYKISNNSLYFYLFGELDECSAKQSRGGIDNLIDNNLFVSRVVFNLSNLKFMDSTGIGMLIGRYKRLVKYSIPLYIENPPAYIEKIIQLSGIYEVIPKL